IVSGIGIMNIMLVSVTERTREIGIRKAIGARRKDILSQFLIEAVLISLFGGIVGVLIGVGTVPLANYASIEAIQSIWGIVLAFLFSILFGVFFGYYPAQKAAKLDAIVALRYE
ncbi:MAG TPA: macrolide ABC transporter permease, partial [Actinobacteria bacterium]|nr:macrolide ABC transporter permease [Actinomycetota bacterium]